MAFRGGGGGTRSGQGTQKGGDEYDTTAVKDLKEKNNNQIMRLPIGGKGDGRKGGLVTPTTFKENPIKANVPVIREFSITPLAYRRFGDGTG